MDVANGMHDRSNGKEVIEATIEIDVPAAAEAGIALEEWDNGDELSWSNSTPTLMRDASFASVTDDCSCPDSKYQYFSRVFSGSSPMSNAF